MNPRSVAVGAVTAVLALLALTAMHALPTVSAHGDPVMAAESPDAAATHATHAVGAVTHNTGGVPTHGHTLLHLCVAVLVVGLSLALAVGLRRRPWTSVAFARLAPLRTVLSRDIRPPGLAGLCLLRC